MGNGENCVEIYKSQLMNDKSCAAGNKFRCRIETYLDDDDKLRVCLNNPSADQCQVIPIKRSKINDTICRHLKSARAASKLRTNSK